MIISWPAYTILYIWHHSHDDHVCFTPGVFGSYTIHHKVAGILKSLHCTCLKLDCISIIKHAIYWIPQRSMSWENVLTSCACCCCIVSCAVLAAHWLLKIMQQARSITTALKPLSSSCFLQARGLMPIRMLQSAMLHQQHTCGCRHACANQRPCVARLSRTGHYRSRAGVRAQARRCFAIATRT